MPRISKLALSLAAVWALVFLIFVARPTPILQVGSMLLTIPFLVTCLASAGHAVANLPRTRWRGFVPVAVCGVTVIVAFELVAPIQGFAFKRALPRCEALIRSIESGQIPVALEMSRLPVDARGTAYAVLGQRSSNHVLTVEFLTGSGFPVKHSGYLYCSSGAIEKGSIADKRWPRRREIQPRWFRVAD